jgi:hypothetical protein
MPGVATGLWYPLERCLLSAFEMTSALLKSSRSFKSSTPNAIASFPSVEG